MADVLIIDNSAHAFYFQPENALPCITWYNDKLDTELKDFMQILVLLSEVRDVRDGLKEFVSKKTQ